MGYYFWNILINMSKNLNQELDPLRKSINILTFTVFFKVKTHEREVQKPAYKLYDCSLLFFAFSHNSVLLKTTNIRE